MNQYTTRLSRPLILAWADAFHDLYGHWPTAAYGPLEGIPGGEGFSWMAIDNSLKHGRHGLRGRISLSQLLQRHRGHDPQRNRVRPLLPRPALTTAQVLRWVDAYVERYGKWPSVVSGSVDPVIQHPETWRAVDEALRSGRRGLPGGGTLQKFLETHRGKMPRALKPLPTMREILQLIRTEYERTGVFPRRSNVHVPGWPDLTWTGIDTLLRRRGDGQRSSSTVAIVKSDYFGFRHHMRLPPLTVEQVLKWADAHYARHGRWPIAKNTFKYKNVEDAPGEQWPMISRSLRRGDRELPAIGGLPELLMKYRGVRNKSKLLPVSVDQILGWADEHRRRTGRWPNMKAGEIPGSGGETWRNIDAALINGNRGLRGSTTLIQLLVKHRGIRHPQKPPTLTIKQMLAWADAHYLRTGDWPSAESGTIPSEPDESWAKVHSALKRGKRGLRGPSTLAKFLARHRMPMYARKGILLKRSDILDWAAIHHELTGELPTAQSGRVRDMPGETWAAIDASLRTGSRGLRGAASLDDFLKHWYGPAHRNRGRTLTTAQIIQWAESFRERVGRWPTSKSAYTDSSRTEKWSTIDVALREGLRGLPGGSSLAMLLKSHRTKQVHATAM